MSAPTPPVTAATAGFRFYDIECLTNAFTLCAYSPRPGGRIAGLEVFFLAEEPAAADDVDPTALYTAITRSNPGLVAADVHIWDLRRLAGNLRLAELIGLSDAEPVNNIDAASSYPDALRPVCDTDADYHPVRHPFLAGYNSLNYDTVMIALYLMELRLNTEQQKQPATFQPVSTRAMRAHNDHLFSEQYNKFMPGYLNLHAGAGKIRRAMLSCGRHLDVSRLNEQQAKVSLKRLLGMLGHQIKESDKLSHDTTITSTEELYELLAYNVSDCLGLAQLFRHPAYAGNFDLKAGLLGRYRETVCHHNGTVRRDRLNIDASSARFVGRILAPYKALGDSETVSLMYPHEQVAAERGIARVNVLDECLRFFEDSVASDRITNQDQAAAYSQFLKIVAYYRRIEGKNFNASNTYRETFPHSPAAQSLKDIPKSPNNIPYFRADGSASSCFATFSTGGIHGAEADLAAFAGQQNEYDARRTLIEQTRQLFPDARAFVAEAKNQHNRLCLPDGSTVDKRLVLLGSDPATVRYRKPKKNDPRQRAQLERSQLQVPVAADLLATQRSCDQELDVDMNRDACAGGPARICGKTVLANATAVNAAYRDRPAKTPPTLFSPGPDGDTKLHPSFARTSAGLVVHEDFTSYYPNLLRNMRAFYNPELGEDRYATIFFDKEALGSQLKQPGLEAEERARLTTLRNGTKLILNAASGAGDASHDNPIRMNNTIIAMRIIGQLFSWRIGQAQTLAGARIISTNTDGLYSVVDADNGFDENINRTVLQQQQQAIGVDIEPEPMFLISKDSNNRLELGTPPDGQTALDSPILSAGGGTLACHAGPTPTKALAHPAVVDFALARYLQTVASRGEEALSDPFDADLGRKMIQEAIDPADPVRTLMLFQNVIAASAGSITYPFAADPVSEATAPITRPRALQMVNRVFVVLANTPAAVSLHNAGAWKVPAEHRTRRRATGAAGVKRDPVAKQMLRAHGWSTTRSIPPDPTGPTLLPDDQDVMVRRISGIDPTWPMVICNEDLHALPERSTAALIAALDLEIYLKMLAETFTKNWRNNT